VADDAPTQDLSEETQPAEDAQPEKLRVHSLARVLGTTSKRVLDALTELDGRPRSAQSAVEDDEVERVREALAEQPDDGPAPDTENVPAGPDADGQTAATDPGADGDEPESRLMLETSAQDTPERADYLPLFVAPHPIRVEYDADDDDDDGDDDSDDSGSDSDDDQSDGCTDHAAGRNDR
jgi:ribonuclease E